MLINKIEISLQIVSCLSLLVDLSKLLVDSSVVLVDSSIFPREVSLQSSLALERDLAGIVRLSRFPRQLPQGFTVLDDDDDSDDYSIHINF